MVISLTSIMFDIMFDRKIFGTSSEIFGSLRESSEHFLRKFRMPFGQHSKKTSIGGRNSSENRLRSWYVNKTNKIIHDARIFLPVFNSISQEFANPTREIWSLACEQAPEWGYASEASCERKHLMTSAPLGCVQDLCVAGGIFVF